MGMVPRTPRPSGAHSPRQTGSGQHPGGPRRLGRGWKQQPPPSKEACTRHKRGPEAAAGTGRQSERAGGQASQSAARTDTLGAPGGRRSGVRAGTGWGQRKPGRSPHLGGRAGTTGWRAGGNSA